MSSFPEMPLEEAVECVTRYLDGKRIAFDPVYHFYKNQLLAIARKYHRDLATAEDAVQVTLEKSVVSLASWKRERPIGFWLRSICSRVCLTELERQKRAPAPADGTILDSGRLNSAEPLNFGTQPAGTEAGPPAAKQEWRPPRPDPETMHATGQAPPIRTEREWMTQLLQEAARKEALGSLLERLPEDEYQIVVLFHLENRSHDEISRRLNISSANSRKKLERALRKLRVLADPALRAEVQELEGKA
jgi:RNA polymerase sigma factor (sigma-70 family)